MALLGAQGQRLLEGDEPKRKSVELAELELLFVWHEIAVSNRAAAGCYSLVVEGLLDRSGQPVRLDVVDVQAGAGTAREDRRRDGACG